MQDLLGIALRILVIYLYALFILRLSGKRSVGSLSALDLLVGLIVGDMFDDVIWAEIALAQGLVGMTTVVLLHSLVAWASWKSRGVDQLVNSTPTPVVKNGKMLAGNLQRERTPAPDVEMSMRLKGEDKLEEIQEACWEHSGNLSLRKFEAAKPVQKRDLAALRKVT
jgi:uncharacterized membrane protein YcaP (DUF421 family)